MARCIFITGTDTEVGKTYVTQSLLKQLNQHCKANGYKPVAADAKDFGEGLRNQDALSLLNNSALANPYELVNPYCFEPPIAPHIAAADIGVTIETEKLNDCLQQVQRDVDIVLIEGAGGWLLPLSETELMSDWVTVHNFEVILIVGVKLGCLNHSLLTVQSILSQGLKLNAWVANCLSPRDEVMNRNITYLEQQIAAPCLAQIEFNSNHTGEAELLLNETQLKRLLKSN
ncbi:dethiobiotin synthase [Alginatibacterium sediminis]|uniref:ATP-dependent dethiobiotin synthetase BioD n=1 Tax=Alginatibacterium sediminis TaxID=2164068 RepID=A0A420EI79_9ALTE|nr:dethiobiotin synthase [Alginatibacterium sediminis]RKF20419.1 dethiobiotin synthase [Alginatibacterium sediminis]